MKSIVKYTIPIITFLAIVIMGYFLVSNPTPSLKNAPDARGCNIQYRPTVKKYSYSPSFCINENRNYSAEIETSLGNIYVSLWSKNAPKTVNNFVFLSKSGFYDNLTFHRVIPGFVIQGGDPKGDGTGNPGYSFSDEINPSNLGLSTDEIKTNEANGYIYNFKLITKEITTGVLAMANSGANTNGSQFFVTLSDQPTLNGLYTPFGIVTKGFDIAQKISNVARDPSTNKPNTPITINRIIITEY